MSPIVIAAPNASDFSEEQPVGLPVGEPVAHAATAHHTVINEKVSTGIWKCSPGSFRRQIMQAEYSYFIEGEGVFTPDEGEPVAFKAGDAIYFHPNTEGTWLITSTVRKGYIIL